MLDISGDVGIKARGESCEAALINAGLGMYSLVTDIGGVDERQKLEFDVSCDSLEGLAVNYLNELVFQFDSNGFIGRRIEITGFGAPREGGEAGSRFAMKVSAYGEEFDPERHERRLLIKAATYHRIRAERGDGGWEIDVIFDI